MTAHARHRVTRLLLALALRQRFHLAHRAQRKRRRGLLRSDQHEVANVIGERIPWPVFVNMVPSTLDRNLTLEMALHAYLIAASRCQLHGIDDRRIDDRWDDRGIDHRRISNPFSPSMLRALAIAAFAAPPILSERGIWVKVLRASQRRLHS